MKNRFFIVWALVLVLFAMQFGIFVGNVKAETITGSNEGVNWSYDTETKTLTFSGNGKLTTRWKSSLNENVIQKVIIEPGINEIGTHAFSQCKNLNSVNIPGTVSIIGESAFRESDKLANVDFQDGTEALKISTCAFLKCTGLKNIELPNRTKEIEGSAFNECTGITNVTIPSNVESLDSLSFSDCSELSSIEVDPNNSNYCSVDGVVYSKDRKTIICYPGGKKGNYNILDGVTVIEIGAFQGCGGLTGINIPNSVTEINRCAFQECSGLVSVKIPNSVTKFGEYVFLNCKSLTECSLPDNYPEIPAFLCNGCANLENIEIPSAVKKIGSGAFDGTGLTSIVIPSNIEDVGQAPFNGCDKLNNIEVAENNKDYSSVDGVLYDKDKKVIIRCPAQRKGEYVILDGVETIAVGALSGCVSVTNIDIPSSVTKIESGAFSGCSGLTSLEIPLGVKEIEHSFISNCSNLKTIAIPESVETIGSTWTDDFSGQTMYCKANSTAQQFAQGHNMNYVIDGTAPTITKLSQDGDYIVIEAKDNDGGAGLSIRAYSLDGKNWFKNNKLAVDKDGKYTVYVKDALSNTVTDSIQVTVSKDDGNADEETDEKGGKNGDDKGDDKKENIEKDETSPEIISIEVNRYIIKINAKDNGSGLADEAYSLNNKNWQSSNEIKVEKDGQYIVYVRDKEGNIARKLVVVSNNGSEKEESNTTDNSSIPDNNSSKSSDKDNTTSKAGFGQYGEKPFAVAIALVIITIAAIVYRKYKKLF